MPQSLVAQAKQVSSTPKKLEIIQALWLRSLACSHLLKSYQCHFAICS